MKPLLRMDMLNFGRGVKTLADESERADGELTRRALFSEESLAYVRRYYGVPASVGQRVVADGSPGVIIGGQNQYILVQRDGTDEKPAPWHPTWNMEYVDA